LGQFRTRQRLTGLHLAVKAQTVAKINHRRDEPAAKDAENLFRFLLGLGHID
jgi:hypothetical protein